MLLVRLIILFFIVVIWNFVLYMEWRDQNITLLAQLAVDFSASAFAWPAKDGLRSLTVEICNNTQEWWKENLPSGCECKHA